MCLPKHDRIQPHWDLHCKQADSARVSNIEACVLQAAKCSPCFQGLPRGRTFSLENSRSDPLTRPQLPEHCRQFKILKGLGVESRVISAFQFSQKKSYARQEVPLSLNISSALPSDRLYLSADTAGTIGPPPPQPPPQFSLAPLITLTSDFEMGETAALKAGLGRAACDLNLLFISQRAGSVNRTRNITAPAVILCHQDQKASRPSRITFLLWAPMHLLIQAL